MPVLDKDLLEALIQFRARQAALLDFASCVKLSFGDDWSYAEELGDPKGEDWIFLKRQIISTDEQDENGKYAFVMTYACDKRDKGLGSGESPLYANLWIYETGEVSYWDIESDF